MSERNNEGIEIIENTHPSSSESERTENRAGGTAARENRRAAMKIVSDMTPIILSSILLGLLISLRSASGPAWIAAWTLGVGTAAFIAFMGIKKLLDRRGTTATFFTLASILLFTLTSAAVIDRIDMGKSSGVHVRTAEGPADAASTQPSPYMPVSGDSILVTATMGMSEMRLPEKFVKNDKLAFVLKDLMKEGRLTMRFEVPERTAEDIRNGKYLKRGNVLEAVDPDTQDRIIRFIIKSIRIIAESQDPETIMVLIGRELYQELSDFFSKEGMDDRLVQIQKQLDRIEGYLVARHLAMIRNAHDCVKKAQAASLDTVKAENYNKAIEYFQAFRNENKYLHKGRGNRIGKELGAVCKQGWLAPTTADFDVIYGSVRDYVSLYTVIDYCATAEIMLHEKLGQMSIARELREDSLENKIDFLSFVGCFMTNNSDGTPKDCALLDKSCFYSKVKEIAERGAPDKAGVIDSGVCAKMLKKISAQRNALRRDMAALHQSLIVDLVCVATSPAGSMKLVIEEKPRRSFMKTAQTVLRKATAQLNIDAE